MMNDYVYEVAFKMLADGEDIDSIIDDCRQILMDDVREVLRDIRIELESAE